MPVPTVPSVFGFAAVVPVPPLDGQADWSFEPPPLAAQFVLICCANGSFVRKRLNASSWPEPTEVSSLGSVIPSADVPDAVRVPLAPPSVGGATVPVAPIAGVVAAGSDVALAFD